MLGFWASALWGRVLEKLAGLLALEKFKEQPGSSQVHTVRALPRKACVKHGFLETFVPPAGPGRIPQNSPFVLSKDGWESEGEGKDCSCFS